jgi:hypothetical protein
MIDYSTSISPFVHSSSCLLFLNRLRQVEEANAELELVVYNFEKGGHQFVGSVIVTLAELESGETSDEWFPLLLHPSLRESAKGELVPLLRVQMTLAAFRWDRLPPRPVDFIPDYRMPTRCGPGENHPDVIRSFFEGLLGPLRQLRVDKDNNALLSLDRADCMLRNTWMSRAVTGLRREQPGSDMDFGSI